MTIVVRKLGGSVAVVLPRAVAREMELAEGTALEMESSASQIVLRKPRRRAPAAFAACEADQTGQLPPTPGASER